MLTEHSKVSGFMAVKGRARPPSPAALVYTAVVTVYPHHTPLPVRQARRRVYTACVSYREECVCVSYREECVCVSYREECVCVSYREECVCVSST
jgi:hypothetical protein